MEAEGHTRSTSTARRCGRSGSSPIRWTTTALAVQAVVERDYDLTVECRDLFGRLEDREQEISENYRTTSTTTRC